MIRNSSLIIRDQFVTNRRIGASNDPEFEDPILDPLGSQEAQGLFLQMRIVESLSTCDNGCHCVAPEVKAGLDEAAREDAQVQGWRLLGVGLSPGSQA